MDAAKPSSIGRVIWATISELMTIRPLEVAGEDEKSSREVEPSQLENCIEHIVRPVSTFDGDKIIFNHASKRLQ